MKKKKLLIGITGGIGSGKTEVSKMLARRGYKIFYADTIAKGLYKTDKQLVKKIVKAYGKDILNFKGHVNLHKLREKVFSSKKHYETINKIVHPVVINLIKKEARKSKFDIILIESALLFESGFNKDIDYVIMVFANKKNRIDRLMIRDEASRKSIEQMMKFQMDDRKKVEMSDFVIMNNKSLKELKVQVDFLSMLLKALVK